MRKYENSVSSGSTGLPVYLAEIQILNADLSPVTVYSDEGVTPLAQPVLTDGLGLYAFYVADGTYTLVISGPGGINPRTIPNVEIFEDARNVSTPVGEAGITLPSVGARANTLLGFNGSGAPISVAASATDLATIAAVGPQIAIIAPHVDALDIVSDNIWPVVNVHNNIGIVTTVHDDIANVNTVAGMSAAIATVNGNATNINTVATNNANVTAVGANIANVNAVATDMALGGGLSFILRAPQAAIDAVAAKDLAVAVVQAPGSVGRPVGTAPITGSPISPAVYIYAIPLSTNVHAFQCRAYNNSGSAKNVRIGRMTLSGGVFTQIGSDTLVSVPAGDSTVALSIDANAGEYIWVEPTSTAFTYTSGTNVGDNGGYYLLASNLRTGAQSALTTGTRLQFALDFNYVAVTGPDYLVTKSRIASLEAGPSNANPRPLDAVPTLYGVFSTRRMLVDYSGPLVRLRRSVDSVEADFYTATGTDLLDVAAITTWLNGSTGYVRQFYSQKGSASLCIQNSPASQPTLTISGSDAWVTFAASKFFDMNSMSAFAQNKDGVTAGIIGQIPGTAGGDHNLLIFSAASGVSRSRFGVLADNSNRLRTAATAWDEVSGYTGVGSEVSVSTNWFAAVSRASYRTGPAHMQVNGTDALYTMTECVKSQDTASLNSRINGYGADVGMAWNLHTLVLSDIAQSDVNAEVLRQALIVNTPGYTPAAAPSTVFLVGDSQVAGNTIVLGSTYQPTATYADRPGPVVANKYQTATGNYRPVKAKGSSGATSTTIKNSFISNIVPLMTANDVLYIQVGQNNAITTAPERQVVIDDIAAMIAASPTTKIIVGGNSYWRAETETPLTTGWTNKKALNDAIAAAFPTQYWAMQDMMKTYGGNTDGRTPDALLWRNNAGTYDAGHRGVLGTQVEYAEGHSGQPGLYGVIVARGY